MMNYSIVFSEEDFQVLSNALVELPFKTVAPLIQKINQQIVAQHDKAVSKTAPSEKETS